MKRLLSPLSAVFSLLLALPAPLMRAQIAGEPASPPLTHASATDQTNPEQGEVRFDLDFPGGTPAQLAEAIRKTSGKPCNVVAVGEAANWQIPAIKVHNVTKTELFTALSNATLSQVKRSENEIVQTTLYTFSLHGPITDSSTWHVLYNGYPQRREPIGCTIVNLTEYLKKGFSVDDITTAVTMSIEVGGGPAPTLKFHKETRLLAIAGTAMQCAIAEDTLAKLRGQEAGPVSTPTPNAK